MTFWLVSMSKTYRGFRGCKRIEFEEASRGRKRKARWHLANGLLVLATSYSRTAYRRTTIGAAAFHCRVRNGNGWCHCATITRVRNRTGIFAAIAATQARGRISGYNCRFFKEL